MAMLFPLAFTVTCAGFACITKPSKINRPRRLRFYRIHDNGNRRVLIIASVTGSLRCCFGTLMPTAMNSVWPPVTGISCCKGASSHPILSVAILSDFKHWSHPGGVMVIIWSRSFSLAVLFEPFLSTGFAKIPGNSWVLESRSAAMVLFECLLRQSDRRIEFQHDVEQPCALIFYTLFRVILSILRLCCSLAWPVNSCRESFRRLSCCKGDFDFLGR